MLKFILGYETTFLLCYSPSLGANFEFSFVNNGPLEQFPSSKAAFIFQTTKEAGRGMNVWRQEGGNANVFRCRQKLKQVWHNDKPLHKWSSLRLMFLFAMYY